MHLADGHLCTCLLDILAFVCRASVHLLDIRASGFCASVHLATGQLDIFALGGWTLDIRASGRWTESVQSIITHAQVAQRYLLYSYHSCLTLASTHHL